MIEEKEDLSYTKYSIIIDKTYGCVDGDLQPKDILRSLSFQEIKTNGKRILELINLILDNYDKIFRFDPFIFTNIICNSKFLYNRRYIK